MYYFMPNSTKYGLNFEYETSKSAFRIEIGVKPSELHAFSEETHF